MISPAHGPRTRSAFAHIALSVLVAGCARSGCGAGGVSPPGGPRNDGDASRSAVSPTEARARCHRELANAAVAVAPGQGAIDTLWPACGPDDSLTVFAVRGHTLSRLLRSREPGAVFAPPEVLATGVDRLGPVGPDDALGPLAWRSPTSSVDSLERDQWWAASLDGHGHVSRGARLLGEGSLGVGAVAPVARLDGGVEALATVAREGHNPSLVHGRVATTDARDDAAPEPEPDALAEGELEAYEPEHRVALVLAVEPDGATELRALALGAGDGGVAERGRMTLPSEHVLVVARGVARGGESLFAYSSFAPSSARGSDAGTGPCIDVAPGLCVRAGPPTLLVVGAAGMRTVALARAGLVDTLGLDGHDRALVLFVAPGGRSGPVEGAARVDPSSGRVEPLELRPTDAIPPLDHPSIVRCDHETWLAAEVLIEEPDGGDRRSAVLAAPLGCVLSTPAR